MSINYLLDWLRTPVMTHELSPKFVKILDMTIGINMRWLF